MNDAYSAKEIARAVRVSRQAIQQRASAEDWPVHQRGEGKAWRTVYYALASLPADIREALNRVSVSAAASAGRREGLKLKLESEAKAGNEKKSREEGLVRFACLGEKAKSRADAKLALLSAFAEFIRAHGLSRTHGRELFAHQYNVGEVLVDAAIRETIPKVCSNTLDNWEKRLREGGGMARLAGNYGKHLIGTGKIDSNQEVQNLILGLLALNPDTSCKRIMRGIGVRFPQVQLSMRVLQRWVKDWKEKHPRLVQDLKSPDTCRSKYQPAAGSRYEGIVRLNQRWEMDSTKGDVMLNVEGKKTRHMIVACIDVYSRRVKFLVSRSSTAMAVASLLRRCLLDWGQVEELGTDNGTDFVSNHIARIAQALDITRDVAPPFTPEHKPYVERVFKTFLHDMVEDLEGYIGHNVAERKAIEDKKSFAKRTVGAWRKGNKEAPAELLMTPDELQKFCDEWSDAIYAHEPHSGEGMNGKSPWQKAVEYTGQIRKITDERALDVLLSPVAGRDGWREISKKGIRTGNFKYTSPLLGGHEGKSVLVLEDAADWGAVHVFLPNASGEPEYLCRAVCPEILGISRRDMALALKRVYQRKRTEEKAAVLALAKEVRAEEIVREVREHAVEQAGKLSRLPQPTIPHETEALRQAGFAARAQDGPTPAPIEQAQAMRDLAAREMAKPAVVHKMPETPQARYRRWVKLNEAVQAGTELAADDRRWWKVYQAGTEFRSMRDLEVFFGTATAKSV